MIMRKNIKCFLKAIVKKYIIVYQPILMSANQKFMGRSIFVFIISCALLTISGERSCSQTIADTSAHQSSFKNAVALFRKSLGVQSPIYNGRQYFFHEQYIKGNAYFQDNSDFATGSVFYDGVLCVGVPMLYDIYSNQVVVFLPDRFSTIYLSNERVKSFDFLNHHFININTDTLIHNESGIKSGYYDEVYQGKVAVLVKRLKTVQVSSTSSGLEYYFSYAADFYVRKDNSYYSAANQNSLLDVLKDRKKELQHFINSNKIKFRRNPEESLVKISSYYDHLAN